MINPLSVKTLRERPEFKELVEHFLQELNELNNLDNFPKLDLPIPIAIELKARKHAFEKLSDIIAPLIDSSDIPSGGNNKDYVV